MLTKKICVFNKLYFFYFSGSNWFSSPAVLFSKPVCLIAESGISCEEILQSNHPFQARSRARGDAGLEMKEQSKFIIFLFLSTLNILPATLSKNPHECVVEVSRERRQNVSGTEFCWTWGFSCPSLREEIVRRTENVTLCCPGFLEDDEGNCAEIEEDIGFSGEEIEREEEEKSAGLNCIADCHCSLDGCEDTTRDCNCRDNNLFYLIVILPLITLVILILVLIYFILKMKAKLRILREHKTNKVRKNNENETNRNMKEQIKTEREKTFNNPLYYDNSGFCTISEKNINKESTVKVAIHKGKSLYYAILYSIFLSNSELHVNSLKEGASDVDEYDHLDHHRSINEISETYLSFYA